MLCQNQQKQLCCVWQTPELAHLITSMFVYCAFDLCMQKSRGFDTQTKYKYAVKCKFACNLAGLLWLVL